MHYRFLKKIYNDTNSLLKPFTQYMTAKSTQREAILSPQKNNKKEDGRLAQHQKTLAARSHKLTWSKFMFSVKQITDNVIFLKANWLRRTEIRGCALQSKIYKRYTILCIKDILPCVWRVALETIPVVFSFWEKEWTHFCCALVCSVRWIHSYSL